MKWEGDVAEVQGLNEESGLTYMFVTETSSALRWFSDSFTAWRHIEKLLAAGELYFWRHW